MYFASKHKDMTLVCVAIQNTIKYIKTYNCFCWKLKWSAREGCLIYF